MVQLNELEKLEERQKLAEVEGTAKHIQINERTLQAYREEFGKKGLVIEQHKDYPMHETGYKMVKRLKKFDSIVDPSTIKKIIGSMVRQPITTFDKTGKAVVKDALYYEGQYRGYDKRGIEIGASFSEGYFKKPRLVFTFTDSANPYDPKSGAKRGQYATSGFTFEHYMFLLEDKKERRKQLEDIIQKATGTYKGNLERGGHLSFRQASLDNNHSGSHGGSLTWNQFCDLSLKEGLELQDKAYYKQESTGILLDKDGRRVNYNQSTGKIEAIK